MFSFYCESKMHNAIPALEYKIYKIYTTTMQCYLADSPAPAPAPDKRVFIFSNFYFIHYCQTQPGNLTSQSPGPLKWTYSDKCPSIYHPALTPVYILIDVRVHIFLVWEYFNNILVKKIAPPYPLTWAIVVWNGARTRPVFYLNTIKIKPIRLWLCNKSSV